MSRKSSRIYIRGSNLFFLIILSLLFVTAQLLYAFIQIRDNSRFMLLYPAVLLCLGAYYIHKGSVSWMRISDGGKELVRYPCWFARRLLDEKSVVAAIEPGAEFIMRRRMAYGGLNGYSIILRSPSGSEQVIWETSEQKTRLGLQRIADQITKKWRLPVRFVSQTTSDQGTDETAWTAEGDRARLRRASVGATWSLLPYLGVAVRILTARMEWIALIGLALLLLSLGAYFWFYRRVNGSDDSPKALIIAFSTACFIAAYALCVFFTGVAIKGHWVARILH